MNEMLGSLQIKIMNHIWEHGPSLVRSILEDINKDTPENDKLAYTTVLTVTRNLVKKGFLSSGRDKGLAHVFSAAVQRDDYLKSVAKHLKETVFNGTPFKSTDEYLKYV